MMMMTMTIERYDDDYSAQRDRRVNSETRRRRRANRAGWMEQEEIASVVYVEPRRMILKHGLRACLLQSHSRRTYLA
jgi:hypothetical protein